MSVHRFALLVLISGGRAWSRFTEFAATDDPQHLYFTSQLRLSAESSTAPEYRVFHFGPKGTALFAERGPMTPNDTAASSGNDGVTSPQVSGDGGIIGVTAHNVCSSGSSCTPSQTEVLLRGARRRGTVHPRAEVDQRRL